ncbi:MAG: tRNA (5-methylaminomethyl-2-thiouridine)(34)-methyltransferase MnmD, partial [Sinomicrobium sp.]|nr:tRNA (5-methylaminomethyl-2-thiouridine)(34)-methyltransferase MnmD [Sinomicrobium sp.]
LNAFITFLEAEKHRLAVHYEGVEAYPVTVAEVIQLNYPAMLKAESNAAVFTAMHRLSWGEAHRISTYFILKKRRQFFSEIEDQQRFDLVYFDAFGARVQPELWGEALFSKMFSALKRGGVLVTYAAKGSARRAMQTAGFTVERLAGPPGKREMLRAIKR